MLSTWSRLDYRRKGRPGWQKISTGLACWANSDIIASIGERSGSVEGLKRCRPGTAACRSHRRDDRSRFGLSVSWFATPSPTKPAACSATTSCRAVLRSTSTRSAAVQPHARQLIWRLICQGSARKCVRSVTWRDFRVGPAGASWACVSGRRAVRLICAGWLPQDGLFGWSVRWSRDRAWPAPSGEAAHSCAAGHSTRCRRPGTGRPVLARSVDLEGGQ